MTLSAEILPAGSLPAQWKICLAALSLLLPACTKPDGNTSEPTYDVPGLIIVRDDPPPDQRPETFDTRPYFHDFGRRSSGNILRHTFRFRNQDLVPVTVTNIDASCGCTVPTMSYTALDGTVVRGLPNTTTSREILTIPPGAIAELTVRLDTSDVAEANRDKLSTVRLRTNSKTTSIMSFEVHVIVERLFQATPPSILKNQVPVGAGTSGSSDLIRAVSTSPAKILGLVQPDHSPLEVQLIESQRYGEPVWTLSVVFPPGMPFGPFFREIELRTTDSEGKGEEGRFKIPVRAQIVPDVIVVPPTVFLGSFDAAEGKTTTAELKALAPGQRLLVEEVIIEGLSEEAAPFVKVTATAINPDDQGRSANWQIQIEVSGGSLPNVVAGRVILQLDDSQTPQASVPFSGRPSH